MGEKKREARAEFAAAGARGGEGTSRAQMGGILTAGGDVRYGKREMRWPLLRIIPYGCGRFGLGHGRVCGRDSVLNEALHRPTHQPTQSTAQ